MRVWSVSVREKHVYSFERTIAGNDVLEVVGASVEEAKWIVGGKGATLQRCSRLVFACTSRILTTCQTCVAYSNNGNVPPEGVTDEIEAAMANP